MPGEYGASSTVPRAWRIAALPVLAVLGIALPLTFATHTEPFLFEFRAIDLLPIYGTAWLVLAAIALPVWIILTLPLLALEASHRAPFPLLARAWRVALIVLAALIVVETLVYCFETWLGTFGHSIGVPDAVVYGLAVAVGLAMALTAPGRAGLRTVRSIGAACTVMGAIAVVSLPAFGWHRAALRPTAGSPGANRPNILLLSIDALSAPHMSLYGAARPTTPNLDAFAREATTFDRAYSDGNFTTPGIASILTGTRPWSHRALQLPTWALDRTRSTSLPAVLRRNGYRLGYVSTNAHAGGSAQGFGGYFQFARTDRTQELTLCRDGLSRHLRFVCAASEVPPVAEFDHLVDLLHGPPRGNLLYDPRLAIEPALAWLAGVDRDKPIFLWVHLFPPHSPYAAPEPWLGRFDSSPLDRDTAHTQPSWAWLLSRLPSSQVHTLEARYDESVTYVDHYAGDFVRRAQDLLGPNTVVIVTADHGESFGHGYGAHTGPGLYEEIIHVPLIVKLPGQTVGKRSEALVEQVDIAPTLAEIIGVPDEADWEGRSLLGECSATELADRSAAGDDQALGASPPVFSMNFEQNPRLGALRTGSVAVMDGKWKLVHYMGVLHYPDMPPLHDELYDLSADPAERVNRIAAEPVVAQRLRQLIDAELARRGGAVRKQRATAQIPADSSRPSP